MPEDNVFEQSFPVKGGDFANACEASCRVKEILKEIGVEADIIRRVAIAAYEAEMNVVMYASEGEVRVSISPEMINLVIEDEGEWEIGPETAIYSPLGKKHRLENIGDEPLKLVWVYGPPLPQHYEQ